MIAAAMGLGDSDFGALHRILKTAAIRIIRREVCAGLAATVEAIVEAMAQAGGVLPLSGREGYVVGVIVGRDPFCFGGLSLAFDGRGVRNA